MKIVSWNCHYGFTPEKAKEISRYDADILIVQECRKEDFDTAKSEWKYKNLYWDDLNDENSNLGVAVFSHKHKIEFTPDFDRRWRYVIPYRFKKNEREFILFAVWTKSGYKNYHEPVYEALKQYTEPVNVPTIWVGDFNTGRNKKNENWYTDLLKHLSPKNLEDCSKEKKPTFLDTLIKKKRIKMTIALFLKERSKKLSFKSVNENIG